MRSSIFRNKSVFFAIACMCVLAALAVLPAFFSATAGRKSSDDESSKAVGYGDYDIRKDKSANDRIAEFRGRAAKSSLEVANVRSESFRGEDRLRSKIPGVKIERNDDLHIPEVIGTDVRHGREMLTPPGQLRRAEVLLQFLRENEELTGVRADKVARLKLAADYKNPENDLSIVEFEQEINNIPVFRGSVKAGFTKNNEMIRVINNLAPGLEDTDVSTDFGDPRSAFLAAAKTIAHNVTVAENEMVAAGENKVTFGNDDFAPTAEKMYFPTEAGIAVPAWRVLIWEPVDAYYIIVDAGSGTMLWRKRITDDQAQAASFNVYANPNAMVNIADNPFPMTPGPTSPNGAQGSPISRTLITRVGNEAPYTFNNNGWITDGNNTLDGNAVQAGLDRDNTNGVDASGTVTGASRVFNFPFNPGVPVTSGNPPAGDAPIKAFTFAATDVDITTNLITKTAHGLTNGWPVRFTTASGGTLPTPLFTTTTFFVVNATADQFSIATASGGTAVDLTAQGTGTHTLTIHPAPCISSPPPMTDFQRAIVTQLFYITNWFHDETYRLGFTEAARNFQQDNFGRGGLGNDRISAEAQDCAGNNNANFSPPADGSRGRMQMFLWTNPAVDFDGSLDADVVIHELTHGLSNRLHGNSSGLGGLNMSRAMGEGWSDFYAHAMLSEPSDPINGIYPTGSYATYNLRGNPNQFNNYYYGIRRFPKAVMAFTGPNGRPHNPLTFNDVDVTKINLSDGAFASATNPTADGVHAAGEVWSSALWEVRARYVSRLNWADGNRRILQHVTDGMKLAPLNPTFLQERDAILAGALANGTPEDVADIWAGFAIRGMGASASIQNSGGFDTFGDGTGLTRVTEAFDLPNLLQEPTITVSDSTGDNDGILEPGEPVRITVPLKNLTGQQAQNVNVQIVGGGSASYGSIAHNGSASNQINFTIPSGTPCGAAINLTINVTSSLGPTSFQRTITVGTPVQTVSENFDGVTAPALPAGWTAVPVQNGINFVTTTINSNSAPNAAFAADPTTIGGGTDLTMPSTAISTQAATLTFRNRFDTEAGWDGGVVEISIAGGAFQDIITAGGTFLENGYNGVLGAGANNPLSNRNAWSGNSNGYLTTSIRLPAAAAGQNVQIRFRFGADDNTVGIGPNPGWYIDNIQVFGQASCSFTPTSVLSRADFDGDGKSDLSIFRASDNGWYVNKSNGGIDVIQWGLNGDQIVPGRYDGDNKADFAIFRPSENRWYVLGSNGFTVSTYNWGLAGDKPVAGDYDGDGRNDPAVFRPSENKWYIQNSGGGVQELEWGLTGDVPIPADYNADGKTDFAVYRSGQWLVALTGGGIVTGSWGIGGDRPVPADYDGDNKDDFAVWRPSDGNWYVQRSTNGGIDVYGWGLTGDVPAPGDYDGDGSDDPAVFRNGTWFLRRSTAGILVQDWGVSGDLPIPAGYVPLN